MILFLLNKYFVLIFLSTRLNSTVLRIYVHSSSRSFIMRHDVRINGSHTTAITASRIYLQNEQQQAVN